MAAEESIQRLPELSKHLLGHVKTVKYSYGGHEIEIRSRANIESLTVAIPYELYASANFGVPVEATFSDRMHELRMLEGDISFKLDALGARFGAQKAQPRDPAF